MTPMSDELKKRGCTFYLGNAFFLTIINTTIPFHNRFKWAWFSIITTTTTTKKHVSFSHDYENNVAVYVCVCVKKFAHHHFVVTLQSRGNFFFFAASI